jgi:hypothetical protein
VLPRAFPPQVINTCLLLLLLLQVLFDRGRHWDVLHWAWLLSSHPDPLEQYLHGDKDAFLVAFFLAGKVQEYQQVVPGGQGLGGRRSVWLASGAVHVSRHPTVVAVQACLHTQHANRACTLQVRWFAREVLAAMDTSKHGQENPWHHMVGTHASAGRHLSGNAVIL